MADAVTSLEGRSGTTGEVARRDRVLLIFFIVQVISLTFLEKIGYAPSVDRAVPICLVIMLLGLVILCMFVRPHWEPKRFLLFSAFVIAAAVSTFLQVRSYSPTSFPLLLLCYVPFLISFPISKDTHRRALNVFSGIMLVLGGIGIAQNITQLFLSSRVWPNLDMMLPEQFLVPGYVYLQKITPLSSYMKTNGFFFLEVSFFSQFAAIALAVEILYFRRAWRLVFFSVAMVGSFAGTGILMLAVSLPVLLGRLSVKTMAMIILGIFVAVFVAFEIGWYDEIAPRLTEYQVSGSSANLRFVEPYIKLIEFSDTPNSFYMGVGPGNIEKALGYIWWPITKAAIEYGILSAFLFYVFFIYSMFHGSPSRQLSFMLVIQFSIMGGLIVPLNAITCALFCTMFKVEDRQRRRRSSAGGRAVAPQGVVPVQVVPNGS